MRTALLIFTFGLSCVANPVLLQNSASGLVSYGYAVDLSAKVSASSWSCMRQSGYNVAFVRGYSPAGLGQLDPYASANIQSANAAGVGTEVYMTPVPTTFRTGAEQFDEMYGGLKKANINIRSAWIQVTSPVNWQINTTLNINFLNSILVRANQYGVSIGIYTSAYDWNQITGGASITNAKLWYYNVYGGGTSNESPANYNDFRAFGGWTTPMVKQFGQIETVCGVTVNRDVYTTSAANRVAGMTAHYNSEQIVAGTLGLGDTVLKKAEIIEQ